MQSYTLNRPDGALLCRVLEQHTNDAAGAILRLAWMAGLMRDEIQHLTWAQVDLLGEQLLLPDRAVPLAPELAAWLEALRRERNGSSERVVLSDRDQQPLAAQSISRLARAALDAGDLKAVRLIDLRHDYVLRQLERHDWQYVSRITGLEAAAAAAPTSAPACPSWCGRRWCRAGWTISPCGTCAWTTTSGWAARTRCWTLSGARAPSPGMR